MFGAIHVDPDRREHHLLGEVNSVDQQRHQLEPAQIASHQFGESALATDHEPLADRALADAANLNLLGQRFQRTRVTSGRDSQHHLLESSFIERIVRTPPLPARQAQFVAIDTASARTPDLDSPRPPNTSELGPSLARTACRCS
jgi:hypothetical protein